MMRRPQNYGYEPVPQNQSDDLENENERFVCCKLLISFFIVSFNYIVDSQKTWKTKYQIWKV